MTEPATEHLSTADPLLCDACGNTFAPHDLRCRRCGRFRYAQEVEQLINQARVLETTEPARAVEVWARCLTLLPRDSAESISIRRHLAMLTNLPADVVVARLNKAVLDRYGRAGDAPPHGFSDFTKTLVSMAISIFVYAYFFGTISAQPGMRFQDYLLSGFIPAFGFVILLLCHEMGHVFAIWKYGLRASPPIFIPFLGALINLREQPPNAKVEAVVGIGGPILGTAAAVAVYIIALFMPDSDFKLTIIWIAVIGLALNFFNLLPVPPLDGGRITAAVSPWIWLPGVIALGALTLINLKNSGLTATTVILLMVLWYATPRIFDTLRNRGRKDPYYDVSTRAAWAIGLSYVVLAILLIFFLAHAALTQVAVLGRLRLDL